VYFTAARVFDTEFSKKVNLKDVDLGREYTVISNKLSEGIECAESDIKTYYHAYQHNLKCLLYNYGETLFYVHNETLVLFAPLEKYIEIDEINNLVYAEQSGVPFKYLQVEEIAESDAIFPNLIEEASKYLYSDLIEIQELKSMDKPILAKPANYAILVTEHRDYWAYLYEALNMPFLLDNGDTWKFYVCQQGEFPSSEELVHLKAIVIPGCDDSPLDTSIPIKSKYHASDSYICETKNFSKYFEINL
jgi:hypothetical protein